ncbi:root phototropism protein 2 [Iris pallida]|uniref:Root phototropism protein 2 n=1 Tax=Iris pallida TaxID=29817 RepID=A0AAX6ELP7_IRIPA|nr:root phototropism protein 2 [Iris pallida]
MATPASRTLSSSMERTDHWVFSQEVPTDLILQVGKNNFPVHKFMMVAKSGYIRRKMLESNPTRMDLSGIPGGEEALERAVKFCYGINFEITVYNVAALRCAAEHLEMAERVCDGNLARRTEEFLAQAALRLLPAAVVVLRACEGLGPVAEEVGIVQKCVDAISLKVCNETNFPTRSPADWWLSDVASLPPPFLLRILISMKTRGASAKTLSSIVTTFAVNALPDFLHPLNTALPFSDPPAHVRTRQLSLLDSVVSLLRGTATALPPSFLCCLLRAAIFLKSCAEIRGELERLIAADLDGATVADLLTVALDCSGERVADLDSVRRIVAGFVEKEGGGVFGGGTLCSAAVQKVARTVDAFVGEIATDEELGVSKFVGVAGALPKSARRFDDDLYRAIDIFLKAHPALDELEKEKVCSVMDPLRLSYEARLHASQNKRLPLQVVLHALYYDQLKIRSGAAEEPAPSLSAAASARSQASRDAVLMKENEALRSELTRMKMFLSDMDKEKKAGKKKTTFFSSVSKKLGKLNPFRQGSKDTLNMVDEVGVDVVAKPRRRRFSIS